MTQEDKDLLLRDLCARIPYGVKVQVFNYGVETVETLYQIDLDGYISTIEGDELKYFYKPYLFPLSSMTGEQKTSHNFLKKSAYANPIKLIKFYHKNHLDYQGLIEKDLAIDATCKNIY